MWQRLRESLRSGRLQELVSESRALTQATTDVRRRMAIHRAKSPSRTNARDGSLRPLNPSHRYNTRHKENMKRIAADLDVVMSAVRLRRRANSPEATMRRRRRRRSQSVEAKSAIIPRRSKRYRRSNDTPTSNNGIRPRSLRLVIEGPDLKTTNSGTSFDSPIGSQRAVRATPISRGMAPLGENDHVGTMVLLDDNRIVSRNESPSLREGDNERRPRNWLLLRDREGREADDSEYDKEIEQSSRVADTSSTRIAQDTAIFSSPAIPRIPTQGSEVLSIDEANGYEFTPGQLNSRLESSQVSSRQPSLLSDFRQPSALTNFASRATSCDPMEPLSNLSDPAEFTGTAQKRYLGTGRSEKRSYLTDLLWVALIIGVLAYCFADSKMRENNFNLCLRKIQDMRTQEFNSFEKPIDALVEQAFHRQKQTIEKIRKRAVDERPKRELKMMSDLHDQIVLEYENKLGLDFSNSLQEIVCTVWELPSCSPANTRHVQRI